jgi:hypothetical protein
MGSPKVSLPTLMTLANSVFSLDGHSVSGEVQTWRSSSTPGTFPPRINDSRSYILQTSTTYYYYTYSRFTELPFNAGTTHTQSRNLVNIQKNYNLLDFDLEWEIYGLYSIKDV